MKYLAIIAILSLSAISLFANDDLLSVENHLQTVNDDDFSVLFFEKQDSTEIINIGVFAIDWQSRADFYSAKEGFIDNATILRFDQVKYKQLVYNSHTNKNYANCLFEVIDTNETSAKGFIFIDSVQIFTSMAGTIDDSIRYNLIDSVNTTDSLNLPVSYTTANESFLQTAYPISFDQPDPYEAGYTTAELSYSTYYDDGGNKLELIKDIDRNDMLVGFKYKSALNNQTYDIFILPNN